MSDGPSWIRSVASIVAFVALGSIVLAATAWLVVFLLPEGTAEVGAEDADGAPAAEVLEIGDAAPGDAAAQVDRCEVVDGVVVAGGRLQNTSGASHAFVLHVAVVVADRLFDGMTTPVVVETLADGERSTWVQRVGAVDPDVAGTPPSCAVERVSLAEEVGSG